MDELCKQHGAFSWCELMTNDVAKAKDFYTTLFGWNTEEMPMAGPTEGMTYTVVKVGANLVGGIMQIPENLEGMPPTWGCYVTVDDVDQTAKTAVELGAKLFVEPRDIPDVGRFCVIQDPQGAWLNVITYKKM